MGYTKSAITGFGWNSAFKIATTILSGIKIIILARILSPNDFGLFSLVTIALGITEAATQTGINITLIQTERSVKYFLDTAWVIAIVRGLIIAIVMGILGIVLKTFYHEQLLLPLVTLAAFVPLIKGFINPSIVNLQKELNFFADSLYRISLVLVETIVAIGLALSFRSVFVLVIAMIASALFEVTISFIFLKDKPTFNYKSSRAETIFQQMKWLNLSSILGYLHENLDNILIGKLSGTTSLGYYQNAYALSHKPNYELAKSVHHSTLPVFNKIKGNKKRLYRAFRKSVSSSSFAFFIFSLPFLIYPQLMVILLGDQWTHAVPLLRPLTIAGVIQSFSMMNYTMFLTNKNYKKLNQHLGLTTLAMVILVLLITPQYGLSGAVWGVALSRIITIPLIIKQLTANN